MEKKICTKCQINKELCEFSRNKNSKDGLQHNCRECVKSYKKQYYIENKETLSEQFSLNYKNNREKNILRIKLWGEKNKDKVAKYKRDYVEKNRDLINERLAARKKEDPILKLKMLYRSKLNKILGNKKEKTFDLIGCSPKDLKIHLEEQFKDGMCWDNHGLYGWHIDHIIPLSSAKDVDELKKLCHYTNLQPLWAVENIVKRDKII